ncbi:MAG: MauE/DoxX family redox-associated membrane protein [Pseudomonadota bacterium]
MLYRMATADHLCPSGLKARDLLRRKGYEIDDHTLTTRAETDAFKAAHDVKTTPQVFIGGERIGGYADLKVHLGVARGDKTARSYAPIIALFSVAALMALMVNLSGLSVVALVEDFVAISMCLLGIQKLRDLDAFSSQFLGYDLLARRYVPYAYVYPFAETGAGLLMFGGILTWIAAPLAFFTGSVGAASVFKAVYIDGRDLKCACVGGNSNVPLGAISLAENLAMMAMAIWMVSKPFWLGG